MLHITRDFPPRVNGGISTAVGGLVRACRRAGLSCGVVSFDRWRPRRRAAPGPSPARDADPDVVRVASDQDLPRARDFAAAFGPDALHVHHGMLWPLAAELRAELRAPAVLTVHVAQRVQHRLRGVAADTLSLAAQRDALASADAVVAPSRAVADALTADDPALAPRLRVLALGVDDSEAARRAAAARAGRAAGPLVYAGRFADVNGTAELFAALPDILARVPGARAVVAGGVPDNRKAEARWRRRWDRTAPAAVRARVRFVGWLDAGELSALYAEAAAVLAPSWFETFGLVVAEAMLHGAPVIAAAAGGIPELIDDGRTGLLVPPRDAAALADAAVALLADPEHRGRLGSAAADAVRARHLWGHVVPDLARLYAAL